MSGVGRCDWPVLADSVQPILSKGEQNIVSCTSDTLREYGADPQKIRFAQPRAVGDGEHACREVAGVGDIHFVEVFSEVGIVRQGVDEQPADPEAGWP